MLTKYYILYIEYPKLFDSICVLSHYGFIKKSTLPWVDPININYYLKHNLKPTTSERPESYTRPINITNRIK